MAAQAGNPSAAGNDKVTLKSSDGCEFAISDSAACLSPAIKEMLSTKSPAETVVPLPNVNGETLDIIVTYLNALDDAGDDEEKKKKIDRELLFGIKMDLDFLSDVVSAASNLGIQGLVEIACGKIGGSTRLVSWVEKAFESEDDDESDKDESDEDVGPDV